MSMDLLNNIINKINNRLNPEPDMVPVNYIELGKWYKLGINDIMFTMNCYNENRDLVKVGYRTGLGSIGYLTKEQLREVWNSQKLLKPRD